MCAITGRLILGSPEEMGRYDMLRLEFFEFEMRFLIEKSLKLSYCI